MDEQVHAADALTKWTGMVMALGTLFEAWEKDKIINRHQVDDLLTPLLAFTSSFSHVILISNQTKNRKLLADATEICREVRDALQAEMSKMEPHTINGIYAKVKPLMELLGPAPE
jgi:hypothetical protein